MKFPLYQMEIFSVLQSQQTTDFSRRNSVKERDFMDEFDDSEHKQNKHGKKRESISATYCRICGSKVLLKKLFSKHTISSDEFVCRQCQNAH